MKPAKKRKTKVFIEIGVSTQYPGWGAREKALRDQISNAVHTTVEHSAIYPNIEERSAELSLVLCDDDFIRALNRDYRGKDKPTNVLSFPQTDFSGGLPKADPLPLGDIILAYQTIEMEAQEQGKPFEEHFTHLIVHGTLHLLGYDHEIPEEAHEMESLEIDILKEIGIENPYSELNFMAQ